MGTLKDVNESDVTIEIALTGHSRYGGQVSEAIVLQIDANTLVFSQDLEVIPLEDLEIDTTVTASARSAWGEPVAKLLYAGTIHDLSERSYRGWLVKDQEDQLLLATPWKEELTVLVGDDTIWVDGASIGPPDELQVGLPLQILGTKQDDGAILAALITSGTVRW